MEKVYDPSNIEQKIYKTWEKNGYFKPHNNKNKESFCIMIPPPNITGSLHLGHAFQQTITDITIRYQRMQGKNTLWQVGTDHAGIATQILVEKKIFIEEGKTKYDYGRDAFIDKVWQWKLESCKTITQQMRRLGNSVDWDCERFTMDEGLSNAVNEVFVQLYKEGLIYRNKRLVNWDPKLCTAISDLEVESKKLKGYMWYIRYPLAGNIRTITNKNYIVVATTRPETILGDTGIAVNPKDSRYKNLIGQFVILPIINRCIPIIGDEYADMKKGTGCVKITPAHDFNDYNIAHRHALPMINILTFDGKIRENAQVFDIQGNESNYYSNEIPIQFQKLECSAARKAIISVINILGLLEEVKLCDLIVPHSDRSGSIIEPMLTDQWFIRTEVLAKPAIEAVKNGNIQFIPKQYENIYFSWMKSIQDWCISRQLWWGHRIPAWYDKHGNVYVGRNIEEVYRDNNLNIDSELYQDEDVLDTWFSSSLWTFSSLGWPNNTNNMLQFHPTNVMISGFDIIFFWIARMIMMTMHFIKDINGNPQVPFKLIYITGLICDNEGKKMSKSKGNVIDPFDMVDGISLQKLLIKRTDNMIQPQLSDKIRVSTEKQFPNGIKAHGTDALRFTLAAISSTGRNINWNMKRLEGYRNFCNKLWNASRFVLINTKNKDCGFNNEKKVLSLADRWILSKLNENIKAYRKALDNFRFDMAANILYEFTWNHFCDWYLELSKSIINNGSMEEQRGTRNTLIVVLESLLRLAHPIIPFITEAIWQDIKSIANITADTIMLQSFPQYNPFHIDEKALNDMQWIKKIVIAIRNIRYEMNIMSVKPLDLFLRGCTSIEVLRINENYQFLKTIACLKNVTVLLKGDQAPASIIRIIDGTELFVPISDFINKVKELDRLTKEVTKIEIKINRIKNKLKNKDFIANAPKVIFTKEYNKLINYTETKTKLYKQKAIISKL